MNLSVFALAPSMEQTKELISNSKDAILLTVDAIPGTRAHFFQDLINGTSLWLKSNGIFQLNDLSGYNSGAILAQKMVFANNDISIWHQDQRFSFTCKVNLKTGFCFGWLIDRRYSKSYRILDPGKIS